MDALPVPDDADVAFSEQVKAVMDRRYPGWSEVTVTLRGRDTILRFLLIRPGKPVEVISDPATLGFQPAA